MPLQLGDAEAAGGAAAQMIVHEEPAAAAQLAGQVGAKVFPELRTRAVVGGPHRFPDARPRCVERAGVHVFLFHRLECLLQMLVGHRQSPS